MTHISEILFEATRKPRKHSLFALLDQRRQRHDLARLNQDLLKDIGLIKAEAANEASRPVWDAPSYWGR